MDGESGRVLYESNADCEMLIASTTKIMTCLVALEDHALSERVQIKREYTLAEGSSMYLKEGEVLTLEELLYGLFDAYGMEMTHQQYVLIGSTVRSYLSYLKESGRIAVAIEDNRVVWRAV